MWQAVGEESKKIYYSAKNKSEVMRWLIKKYPSERDGRKNGVRKPGLVARVLPEPMTIKKADQTAI